ncbi:MAG: hypothetical protein LBQ25_09755 [Azonexus sp.]|nr:hypothetical protein [Azonexus sp.]
MSTTWCAARTSTSETSRRFVTNCALSPPSRTWSNSTEAIKKHKERKPLLPNSGRLLNRINRYRRSKTSSRNARGKLKKSLGPALPFARSSKTSRLDTWRWSCLRMRRAEDSSLRKFSTIFLNCSTSIPKRHSVMLASKSTVLFLLRAPTTYSKPSGSRNLSVVLTLIRLLERYDASSKTLSVPIFQSTVFRLTAFNSTQAPGLR